MTKDQERHAIEEATRKFLKQGREVIQVPRGETASKAEPPRRTFMYTNKTPQQTGFVPRTGDADMASQQKQPVKKTTPAPAKTPNKAAIPAPAKPAAQAPAATTKAGVPKTPSVNVGALQIRRGVPVPSQRLRSEWDALLIQMQPGDSVFVPGKKPSQLAYVRAKGKRLGLDVITAHTVEDGVRGCALGIALPPGTEPLPGEAAEIEAGDDFND